MTRKEKVTVRCAIYTRKSSEEGLDQAFNSLHAQREACEAYVVSQKGEGWSASRMSYDDGGFSGGNLERPGLQRLLADVDARRVDVVVVYKVDRLTRSLADFAKIVERFDAAGVSFVSVTQAFNTTTSMGRLTLNVLLSFAQFEREVTGERIRDKIAASKAKGMWMGGALPLGYDAPVDPVSRALVVNPAEAEIVRTIFDRYLELRSVDALRRWLHVHDVRSKRYVTRGGNVRGGVPFSRGALFHLLRNRTYLGEIPHRAKTYPGAHSAIVAVEIFAAAQAVLRENASVRSVQRTTPGEAPLRGRIFDSYGRAMQASFTRRHDRPYRYYVVSPDQRRCGPTDDEALLRVSAPVIETLIADRLVRLVGLKAGEADWSQLLPFLSRVQVARDGVELELDPTRLAPRARDRTEVQRLVRQRLVDDEEIVAGSELRVFVRARLSVRGGRTWLVDREGRSVRRERRIDRSLIRALRAGHQLLKTCGADGDQDSGFSIATTYDRKLCSMALLAPDIQRAILAGHQHADLTIDRLRKMEIPLAWEDQRAAFGF